MFFECHYLKRWRKDEKIEQNKNRENNLKKIVLGTILDSDFHQNRLRKQRKINNDVCEFEKPHQRNSNGWPRCRTTHGYTWWALRKLRVELEKKMGGSSTFFSLIFMFQVNNIISRKTSQSEYYALIKSGKINVCDLLKNPDRDPFLKILISSLERFGKMMFNCPVKKVHLFIAQQLSVTAY